jgi:hypothetical protein
MCARPATSREHAPPRCLFPAAKDTVDGRDYRKNLITVRSCDEHNSEKSSDDEYMLFVLAGSYTSSNIGLQQFLTKVSRAFTKAPAKATTFIQTSSRIQLCRPGDSEWEEGAEVIVDGRRVDTVLSNCARALYFHHTGHKFQGVVQVLTNFTMYLDVTYQQSVSRAFEASAQFLAGLPRLGGNQEVFWYKFAENERLAIFYMCFYENSPALVRFKKILLAR